jgi:hypothetical protein
MWHGKFTLQLSQFHGRFGDQRLAGAVDSGGPND